MTSLNYEELDRLFKTPCRYDVLRRASIFAVHSGLRRGDILALDWKDYERYPLDDDVIIKRLYKWFTIDYNSENSSIFLYI